ncbi:MAG: class A beta-lactamase [Muribaculaceae bacterium]|nr:class A beta-lactamase [Muribaculaceae bacterium]
MIRILLPLITLTALVLSGHAKDTGGERRPWDLDGRGAPAVLATAPGVACHPAACAIRDSLQNYIADKDARFGIAVILDTNDTISVNGRMHFPMASVCKFPQALALADYCRKAGISFSDSIDISASQMHPDTWSPMRDLYGVADVRLPISEVLGYSLQQSDNNACDALFSLMGGTQHTDSLMKKWGYDDVRVTNTEREMNEHIALGYSNTSTPIDMAMLMEDFDTKYCLGSAEMAEVAHLLENCETGKDRLVGAISKDAVCGHKTGTGPMLPNGRLMAVNDCGYVRRIDGLRYSIAVFVAESGYDLPTTSAMIRDISRIVRQCLSRDSQ